MNTVIKFVVVKLAMDTRCPQELMDVVGIYDSISAAKAGAERDSFDYFEDLIGFEWYDNMWADHSDYAYVWEIFEREVALSEPERDPKIDQLEAWLNTDDGVNEAIYNAMERFEEPIDEGWCDYNEVYLQIREVK
jgi:hypothetical protein